MTESQHSLNDKQADLAPPTPRKVTPAVRGRLMREPKVRFWLLLGSLMLVACIGLTISGILEWRSDVAVIESGPIVKAISWGREGRVANRPLPIDESLEIQYEFQGKTYKSRGPLFRTGENYQSGVPFDIRLDPRNPAVWSNRKTPAGLGEKMIGPTMFLLGAAACAIVGFTLRGSYLRMWVEGELRMARVIEHRQSALAPASVGVYCAVRMTKEERLMTVYIPQKAGVPEVGQNVPVLINASSSNAIALANYQS